MTDLEQDWELASRLPFTKRCCAEELVDVAHRAAHAVGLANAVITAGRGQCGLDLEHQFRVRFWSGFRDRFKLAAHEFKSEAFRVATTSDRRSVFESAWREMNATTSGDRWMRHLMRLPSGCGADAQWLRVAFRIAAQMWSRAGRWQAAMGLDRDCPLMPLIELFELGAVPIGTEDDSLVVFQHDSAAQGVIAVTPEPSPQPAVRQRNDIFLAAKFESTSLTETWRDAFNLRGWEVCFERFPEGGEAIEPQLGRRIRESHAVVGITDQTGFHTGLPWWVYQELDYSVFCSKPTVLIIDHPAELEELDSVTRIGPAATTGDVANDHPVWDWLAGITRP